MALYKNDGQTISTNLTGDYRVKAEIKSEGKDTNSYLVTLSLFDTDTDESMVMVENIHFLAEPKDIKRIVALDIKEKEYKNYFDKFVTTWQERQKMLCDGIALAENERKVG